MRLNFDLEEYVGRSSRYSYGFSEKYFDSRTHSKEGDAEGYPLKIESPSTDNRPPTVSQGPEWFDGPLNRPGKGKGGPNSGDGGGGDGGGGDGGGGGGGTYPVASIDVTVTPTAGDWGDWLGGLGRLSPQITNEPIKVGIYTGKKDRYQISYYGSDGNLYTTNQSATWVDGLKEQTVINIERTYEMLECLTELTFTVETFNDISLKNQYTTAAFAVQTSSYAYAYGPGQEQYLQDPYLSDMFFNKDYDQYGTNTNYFTNGFGSHGFSAQIHETGHTLGLNHTFGGIATPTAYDNFNYSVMTYEFVGGEPASFGVGDQAYLAEMYGQGSYNESDTAYVFTGITDFNDWFGDNGSIPVYSLTQNKLLYDSGGLNSLDFSSDQLSGGVRVSLDTVTGTGSVCYVDDFNQTAYSGGVMTASMTTFSYGSTFDSVTGTTHNDQFLTRNDISETIIGGDGLDVVYLPGLETQYRVVDNGADTGDLIAFTGNSSMDTFVEIEYYQFFGSSVLYQVDASGFIAYQPPATA